MLTQLLRRSHCPGALAVLLATVVGCDVLIADDQLELGKSIFMARCADCHGARGVGVEGLYEKPLVGDASIGELTKLITETMPEGDAEKCVGDDSIAVANYIHYEFYSEAARLRNRPPRIGLARLTAAQLRQSTSDLYSRFAGTMWTTNEHGLSGQYFDGARFRREQRKIERVDPVLNFDFGEDGPGEGINPKDFFIQWRGGVIADVTGRHEIVIRSSCAFICNFGEFDREFINNRVQSGDKTEFRKSVVLTAGRVYPINIDFYQRKRKTKQPPAKISLSWVTPHGTERLIPTRNLVKDSPPATFSLQTKLPPDDRSYGYARGISVDRQWDDSTTAAALEFAQIAHNELWPRYQKKHRAKSNENRGQLRAFLTEIVETAFRGPIDEPTRKLYVDNQVDAAEDDAEAIKRSMLITLKSPRFLYPLLDNDRSRSRQVANRLALTLFDSLPSDQWLLQQAENGKLTDERQIRAAAQRMVKDYRTRGKTREMLYEWLNLGHVGEITKNAEHFPEFSPELVSDLRSSFDVFLDDVVWGESSDFRQFFVADWSYTTPRIADYYGESWADKSDEGQGELELIRTSADPDHRFGVLTHPLLLSGLAYPDSTSPIHRGVFLIRYMLGRTLRPPNEAFTPLSPDLHPDLTTRQRVDLQTSPQSCQVCHTKINGLGFTLENYDADGRYRLKERGRPVNSAGHYRDRIDTFVELKGPKGLAEYLSRSDDAHRAFVSRAFQHFVKQPAAAYGPDTLQTLTDSFKSRKYSIRELLVEIAVIASLQTPEGQPGKTKP